MKIKRFKQINENTHSGDEELELLYFLIAPKPGSDEIYYEEFEIGSEEIDEAREGNMSDSDVISDIINDKIDEYDQGGIRAIVLTGTQFESLIWKSHPNH